MKALITFTGLVFLSSTSLIKWFEAPRGSMLGEPVTSISLQPFEGENQRITDSDMPASLSLGSLISNLDAPAPAAGAAVNEAIKPSDVANPENIKSPLAQPSQTEKRAVPGTKSDDDLTAETKWPTGEATKQAAIKSLIEPVSTNEIPGSEILPDAGKSIELPVRNPRKIPGFSETPVAPQPIRVPEITANVAAIPTAPKPNTYEKNRISGKPKSQLKTHAKKKARRKPLKKTAKKAVAKKVTSTDDWKSAILGDD